MLNIIKLIKNSKNNNKLNNDLLKKFKHFPSATRE